MLRQLTPWMNSVLSLIDRERHSRRIAGSLQVFGDSIKCPDQNGMRANEPMTKRIPTDIPINKYMGLTRHCEPGLYIVEYTVGKFLSRHRPYFEDSVSSSPSDLATGVYFCSHHPWMPFHNTRGTMTHSIRDGFEARVILTALILSRHCCA